MSTTEAVSADAAIDDRPHPQGPERLLAVLTAAADHIGPYLSDAPGCMWNAAAVSHAKGGGLRLLLEMWEDATYVTVQCPNVAAVAW